MIWGREESSDDVARERHSPEWGDAIANREIGVPGLPVAKLVCPAYAMTRVEIQREL
jgi:hypothetical protein